MKHVNEELPDVQRRRPEASAAVALVVERATAKNPAERYQTVAEMIDDLETALEVEAARAGSTTGEATSVLDAVPPPQAQALRPGALVLGGDRRSCSWSAAARCCAVQLISNGDFGGGGADKGKGGNDRDLLGDRLRPRGRRRRGRQQGRTGRRRRPDRDRLGNRALRLRNLRRHQDRARPRRRHLRHDDLAGDADEDDRPHPHPRLGRPGLRRRRRPALRPLRLGRTGRRSRAKPHRPRRSTSTSASPRPTSCSGSPRPPKPATRKAATRSRSATSSCWAERA